MKERPILFSTPMINAILEGRKSQTRRVVKPQPQTEGLLAVVADRYNGSPEWAFWLRDNRMTEPRTWRCPYGQPGDRLWVITIKDIPGHEGRYGAGDDGRIYRVDGAAPRPLRPAKVAGYARVTLCLGRRREQENALVHRLVCSAFYGPSPYEDSEVRHLNGDRRDNRPENLDWGTASQNWADRDYHGRGVRIEHHNAKLDMQKAREIRVSSETNWALAKKYGVAPKTIKWVRQGRTWVEPIAPPPPNMPKWASRITLEVTGVRVERLQEISVEDAEAEGTALWCPALNPPSDNHTQRDRFKTLWNCLAKPGSQWADNPWVWVVEFKRVNQ